MPSLLNIKPLTTNEILDASSAAQRGAVLRKLIFSIELNANIHTANIVTVTVNYPAMLTVDLNIKKLALAN